MSILIADSGATKCEWRLIMGKKKQASVFTQGISPYFLQTEQVVALLTEELLPRMGKEPVYEVYYYGTGCSNPVNRKMIAKALKKVLPQSKIFVDHDLMGAAKALCGNHKGIACIVGTGSNSCYFNGKKIIKNSPGIGYILGDEGSGAYLGKKVIQYYLYDTFDEELKYKFNQKYNIDRLAIIDKVYKQPLANRYLASFSMFLADNRGHYMIENIIEDGLNDFFFQHLCKYNESWTLPINFVGGIAFGFKDVIASLCQAYEFELGKILKTPMDGLIDYHST
jgi:glucosamine kinase